MTVIQRTADVKRSERQRYWSDALSTTFVPLEVRESVEQRFHGELGSDQVGQVLVSQLRSCAQVCVRTESVIENRGGRHLLQVGLLLSGNAVVSQDGRSACLGSHGFVLYETSRPFRWAFPSGDWALAIFTFPRESFAFSSAESREVTVRDLSTAGAAASMLGVCLEDLRHRAPLCEGVVAARLGDVAADLLTTTVIEGLSSLRRDVVSRDRLLRKILRYIEDNLEDPGLTPGRIADAHFISRRQLYKIFAAGQGRPVVQWITMRRLESCRRALLDPAMADTPVSQVGARFGIANPALFSRMFKSAYGMSPTAYRTASAMRAVHGGLCTQEQGSFSARHAGRGGSGTGSRHRPT